jgi:hypothetical protein
MIDVADADSTMRRTLSSTAVPREACVSSRGSMVSATTPTPSC